MFSRIFIERPKLAMVISIVLLFAGALCVTRIPVAEYPEISPPSLIIMATYPGASAEVIANTIGSPIEEEMAGLDNLQYISSDSNNAGSYQLTLTFKPDTDIDMAQVDTQNALKRVESKLPSEVNKLGINIFERSSDMLGMYLFTLNKDAEMNMQGLSNYIRTHIKDELIRIPGLSQVQIFGVGHYCMRVWLDTTKMSSMGISTAEVSSAISDQNISATAGSVGTESSSDLLQFKVNAVGRLDSVAKFEQIVVRTTSDGRTVKLKDIARIELGSEDYSIFSTNDGVPAIAVVIYRNSDSNAISVVDKANERLQELQKHFPKGIEYHMGYDPTEYIRISMREIVETLIITLILVVAITYLFLQSWRATLVPAQAIPVSIMATFIPLYFLGFSLNLLTMFALILVIGSLVDDAIVVAENVTRIMDEEGLSAKEATIKSMQEITGAIIATTLVILAIYAPIGFYGGMVGKIYVQFSVTMCIALMFSTLNALTLSPALCALLFKKKQKSKFNLFKPFDIILNSSRSVYLLGAKMMVRSSILTIIIFAAVCTGCYFLNQKTFTSFIPDEDKGACFCTVELDPGASIERTKDVVQEIQKRVKSIPGVNETVGICGFSMLGGQGENLGFVMVKFDEWKDRKSQDKSIEAIKSKAQELTYTIPSASIRVFQFPAIMGLGATGGISFMFQAKQGQTPEDLEKGVKSLVRDINMLPEAKMAYTTYNASTPQLYLDIDREKAKSLQVPVSGIFSTLSSKLSAAYINDFNLEGYSFKVKIQADAKDRDSVEKILEVNIPSNTGKMVPMSAIATVRYVVGPRIITRFNQTMSASVNGEAKPGISSGQLMNAVQRLVDQKYPGYEIAWTDMSYQERGNDGRIAVLIVLALIFAYLFLVGQYESWTMPLSVLLSVSVAILGAYIGLKIHGNMPLSIYAQLGLVMLIGLSGKSAILMAEFSKQARDNGMSTNEAAMEGGKMRYRAVMMTAWSFVIGVLPMVFATGAGSGSRQAIGVSTFWGMLFATLFGMMMVPPIWALFQRFCDFFSKDKQKSN